ncbi:MAG TPA: ferritin family protein [Candidatus Bathyarchaeia archaeon]|nr:ferritin family protein [Candidatus Bathyarchaeia archaeon]
MKEKAEDFKKVLAGAIYREIGARNFYKRISGSIRNAEGKERFRRLSGDEERHRAKLEGWYKKLFNGKFVADKKELDGAEIRGVHVDDKTGAMAALDIAIKAEMEAEAFYASQADSVEESALKELLLKLSGEEHGHYELLLAERSSLAGGFYWFDIDSSQFLED